MPDQIDSKAVKFLSAEMLVTMAAGLILGGIAFGNLSSAQEAQSSEIRILEAKQETIRETVSQIRVSVAKIESHQEDQEKSARKAAEERLRIEDKLDKLTERLLER